MSTEHTEMAYFGPGTVVAGRYEVLEPLGSGAMGMVVKALDRSLDNHALALKLLYPQLVEDKTTFARFRNEVLLARSLAHPNIIRLYDFGDAGQGYYFLSMEYVQGISLDDRIYKVKHHPVGLDEAIRILLELCAGVAHAHQHGIIHRDLKPDNILITETGNIKITDFGLARTVHFDQGLTRTGEAVGTPLYMSPEQIRGENPDGRCDIYALGIMGYEMLMKQRPFYHDSWFTLAAMHLQTEFPSFADKERGIPKWYEKIIKRCAAKNPDDRFQTADELAHALTSHMSGIQQTQKRLPSILSQSTNALPRARRRKRTTAQKLKGLFIALGTMLCATSATVGIIRVVPPLRIEADALAIRAENAKSLLASPLRMIFGTEIKGDVGVFFNAIRSGDERTLETLLRAGISPNEILTGGAPPLVIAAQHGSVRSAEILLEAGADKSQRDSGQKTALMHAAEQNNPALLSLLLNKTTVINDKDALGASALIYAAKCGRLEVVRELLRADADANMRDNRGWTALMYAAERGDISVAQALIQAKADPHALNNDGDTAIKLVPKEAFAPFQNMLGNTLENDKSVDSKSTDANSNSTETRLRVHKKPVTTIRPFGASAETFVETTIRNVGSATATRIQVVVELPGAVQVHLSGPINLESNQSAVYTGSVKKIAATSVERITLSCTNCLR